MEDIHRSNGYKIGLTENSPSARRLRIKIASARYKKPNGYTEGWIRILFFATLWALATRLSGLWFDNGAVKVLMGLWIAVNAALFLDAAAQAWNRRHD